MLFFRVKREFDQKRKGLSDIYIADELYTAREVERDKLNRAFLEGVNIPKNQTFWNFGARFEIGK